MTILDPRLENKTLHLIGEEADRLGMECYVIGGWVRDLLLHRPSKDIDVVVVGGSPATNGRAADLPDAGVRLAEAVKKRIKGSHLSVFRTYGTAQVKRGDIEVEFVGARKESYRHESRNPIVETGTLEDDQKRRDFTINALAICLNADRYGELLDPFEGVRDMNAGIIRTPLNPDITFDDDPLRMMRAVRFACQLGFSLNITTFEAIQRNAERIKIITRERIADELNKIMLSPKPSIGWKLLDKTGLLPLIFPELAALKGVDRRVSGDKEPSGGYGHKDIFEHTLQVVDNVACREEGLREVKKGEEGLRKVKKGEEGLREVEKGEEGLREVQKGDHELWLRWAALLHDIGKPQSKKWEQGIGWTFHNHNYLGARMIPRLFARMKLPQNEKMEYVKKLVDLHMRPIALIEDTVTDSAVRRLLFEAGDDIDDLMLLCAADITSKNEEKVKRYKANYELVKQKMVELEERDRIRNFQPPVRGEEIMETLGLQPCREVGLLKEAIKEAILDGIIPNEYEPARAFMLEKAKEMGLIPGGGGN